MFDLYDGDKVYNKYTKENLIYKWEGESKELCWTVKIDENGEETRFGYYSNQKDLVKLD